MSELESILDYLETTSLEPHDDYLSEFSYKDQKTLWKYIKELQQENQKQKEVIDKLNDYMYSGYLINSKEIKDILKEVK